MFALWCTLICPTFMRLKVMVTTLDGRGVYLFSFILVLYLNYCLNIISLNHCVYNISGRGWWWWWWLWSWRWWWWWKLRQTIIVAMAIYIPYKEFMNNLYKTVIYFKNNEWEGSVGQSQYLQLIYRTWSIICWLYQN